MTGSALDRLLGYVTVDESTSCWLWRGAVNSKGYGKFKYKGSSQFAHRVAYELYNRQPVPDNYTLDHTCGVTGCVNPAHLEVVTRSENRARQNDDRQTCKRGHALRLRRRGNGFGRHCPICEPYTRRTPGQFDVPLFDLDEL